MGISINGPSGIDTASLIDSLVQIERSRVVGVEKKISDYQVKIDAYSKFQSLVSDISSKASALSKEEGFNIFNTSSSNEDLISVKAGIGTVEGSYDLRVFQTAKAEKMISADGLITSQDADLSSFGVTPGEISIDGTSITIEGTDTIQDLRMKINNATDEGGNKLNVTASVLKISDSNFRLVLAAKDTGAAGVEYNDITGSTLQDLGIIQDASGAKGMSSQQIQSTGDIQAAFDALAVGEVIEYTGTDHNGNEVGNMFVKGSASTIDDLIGQVEKTFNGLATVAVDSVTGQLSITDKIGGSSRMGVASFSMGGVAQEFAVTEAGAAGGGVLSSGSNAFFSVDGINMESESNSASGFISGVTLDLHSVSVDQSVNVEIKRDIDGLTDKVEGLFNAFNSVVRYSKESTYRGDPNDDKNNDGKLAGDMTIRSMVGQLRRVFQQQFDLTGTKYPSLSMLGVKTNTGTGEMELDRDVFEEALQKDFDDVLKVFTTMGYSENSNVSLGRYTEETSSGSYVLEEVDASTMRIRRQSETTWHTSSARQGDVITFEDGPVNGLSLTAPVGMVTAGTSFTFSRGFAEQIKGVADQLTNGSEGLIALRQETLRGSIERAEDEVGRLESRVEKYRERLVKQFTAMEQVISSLQNQSANMANALGSYS